MTRLRHESSDGYAGELHRSGDWRTVLCKDCIQFIVQKRVSAAESGAGARWVGRHFCATRNALMRIWQRCAGSTDPVLEHLPERANALDLTEGQKTAAHV